ncbi:MAG: TonB family protein [Cyclobacteriaceae bacterium]
MELKKNKEYDLEKKSPLFFSIGLVVALACVTLAFEWKSEYEPIDITYKTNEPEEIYVPVATKHKDPEPPKPIEKKKVEKPKSNQPPVIIEGEELEKVKEIIDNEPIDFDLPIEEFGAEVKDEEPEYWEGPVESAPEFPGGMEGFYKYISENMKYPSQAKRMGLAGRVYVRFIVNTDGSVTDVEVIKGIGSGCDEAAKFVLENAPKFIPAKQRGKPVRYRQVIPIYFQLK